MAAWPYNTARWQRLRARHLSIYPMCEACETAGRFTPANTVDHRKSITGGGDPFPTHDGLASLPVVSRGEDGTGQRGGRSADQARAPAAQGLRCQRQPARRVASVEHEIAQGCPA